MSDSEHDEEFEAYLKRRAPIDKRTRSLEHLEPPPELDRIVISNARKAIRDASRIRFFRLPKWALPVGLAATILLSFSIMLDLGVRELRKETAPEPMPMAKLTQQSPGAPSTLAPTAVPPVATTPWPPAQLPPASSSTGFGSNAVEKTGKDAARTRLVHADVAAMRSRIGTEAELAPPTPTPKVQPAFPPNVPLRSVVVTGMRIDPGSRTSPRSPAGLPQQEDASIFIDLSTALASMASSARAAIEGIPDPAARLEQIEKLRSDGQPTQAEREMKRFRETYPDYPTSAHSSRP